MIRFTHDTTKVLALMAGLVWTTVAHANGAGDARLTEASRGTVAFEVATNLPALRVHGKSSSMAVRAHLGAGPGGIVLEQIEASVPVASLDTGLGLRDAHMRKYIFTTAEGLIPDVRFSADRAECVTSGRRTTCTVNGALVIRAISRPFTMQLTLTEEKDSVRASGDGIVKLSSYGIEQPSQLGVRTADEVTLTLELTARRPPTIMASDSSGAR